MAREQVIHHIASPTFGGRMLFVTGRRLGVGKVQIQENGIQAAGKRTGHGIGIPTLFHEIHHLAWTTIWNGRAFIDAAVTDLAQRIAEVLSSVRIFARVYLIKYYANRINIALVGVFRLQDTTRTKVRQWLKLSFTSSCTGLPTCPRRYSARHSTNKGENMAQSIVHETMYWGTYRAPANTEFR